MEFVSFGYWVRRRRAVLDLTQSALAHRVGCATVTIKKIEHDQRRPSRLMAQRLAEQLLVPTSEHESFIRTALGEGHELSIPIPVGPVAHYPPAFSPKHTSNPRDRFVGRERELAWLDGKLKHMLSGEGQFTFIAGSAGRGKTALMMEFIRRAVETHPELVASGGICSAYAGIGDPYLPFREVLGGLTGDLETYWISHAHYQNYVHRIWQALPTTLQVLAEHAPYLLEVLVPGKALLARAAAVAPCGAAWLAPLQAEVSQRRKAVSVPERTTIFSQFSTLLIHLSRQQPLLIVLDDLHWADDASLGLLFHLARYLRNSRIFILGTYRPEELLSVHDPRWHLLENMLGELKRAYGEIILDLNAADQDGGRQFIDAYLDGLPNQFSAAFRHALYQQTGGHPLFTVEFVHEMQARGDLFLGEAGQWREAENLDWNILPARVEAVIAQRLGRLNPNYLEILTVASVEGELFTAEVVAHVLGIQPHDLLKLLSKGLAKRQQLVQERGEIICSDQVLSTYTFRHGLFQQYLYDRLDPGERRRLHGAVAEALEALYHDEVEIIASQLAWHYQEARQAQKAVEYLETAGKRAIQLSGYEEAINLLKRGLALFGSISKPSQQIHLKIAMLLDLGEAQYRSGHLDESLQTYQEAAALAREFGVPQALARAALGYEECRWRFNYPIEPSRRLLEEALQLLSEEDYLLKTRLTIGRARTLMPEISHAQFISLSQNALEMARHAGDPMTLYDALYLIPWGNRDPRHSLARLDALNEMLMLAESADDIGRQQEALNNHTLELLELGDLRVVQMEFVMQQKLIEKAHFPLYHYLHQLGQATLAILRGNFTEGESLANQARQIGLQMNVENTDGIYGIQMFTLRREQERLKEALPLVKLFVEQHTLSEIWRPGLALIYSDLDMRTEAEQAFDTLAADHFAGIPQDALWLTCIAYLAEVCAYLGDKDRAEDLYRFMLPYTGRALVTGYYGVCYGAVDRYLGLLATTLAHYWEKAEQHFEDALALNTRMEAWPWLAHTQHAYARMLLARGSAGDQERAMALFDSALEIACSLGMNALIEKVRIDKGENPCPST